VPDSELITDKSTAETVTKQLASMHAKFWETDRFKGDLSLFSMTGRGHNNGKSTVTQSQHFFFKNGWATFVGLGVGMSATTESLGVALKAKFPALYQLNFDTAPSTFIHGDAGLYNIMFYGEAEMCIFDWQMCQRGRGIFDLAFFLVLSTPVEFLSTNEGHFLELYHAELTRLGVTYPMEQLQEDYQVALVTSWAIIVYVTGLLASKGPIWLEKIKVAGLRTVAAIERTGSVALCAKKLGIKLETPAPISATMVERGIEPREAHEAEATA
jgi:thiamine kinase-like enzyme